MSLLVNFKSFDLENIFGNDSIAVWCILSLTFYYIVQCRNLEYMLINCTVEIVTS